MMNKNKKEKRNLKGLNMLFAILIGLMMITVMSMNVYASDEFPDFTDGVTSDNDFNDGYDESELDMYTFAQMYEGWEHTRFVQEWESAEDVISEEIKSFEETTCVEPHIGISVTKFRAKSAIVFDCTSMREQLKIVWNMVDNTISVYRTWLPYFPK